MLEINENTIFIDRDGYWNFGSDQAYIDYPIKFPTVTIALQDTHELNKLIDAARMEAGHKPMFPENWKELDPEDWDDNGWYNFYVGLNGWSNTRVDACIEAIVQSEWADDNEQSYYIDLTEAEQLAIYNELNKQLIRRFGTSCKELLKEAEEYL